MTKKTTDAQDSLWHKLPRFILLSLALLSSAACKTKPEEAPEVLVTVDATHPTVGDISEEITGDAILAPLAQASIAPRSVRRFRRSTCNAARMSGRVSC